MLEQRQDEEFAVPPLTSQPAATADSARASDRGGEGAAARAQRSRVLPPGVRFLITSASFVIVVAGLKTAAELLRPFVLALFLAALSMPLLSWLVRRRLPKALAVFLTVVTVLAVGSAIVALIGGSLNSLTAELPKYQDRMSEILATLQAQVDRLGLGPDQMVLTDVIDAPAVVEFARTTLAGVANLVSKGVLVLLFLIFILLEATGFRDKLRLAFGFDLEARGFTQALEEVQSYLVIKTAISLMTGLLIWAWVELLGIDFAVLWGLVAFLLNYIPNLGSIIAAIPTVLLALVQGGIATALLAALGYVVVNFVLGNLLEPNLLGRRLGLSTLVVFASLVFWGWVWGPLGMLLSVPLTMGLRILFENVEGFRWLAILLGQNPKAPERA